MEEKLSKYTIDFNLSVKHALEMLNELPETLTLFVLDMNNKLVGTLTDGDIRRNLLKGKSIDDKVSDFMFMDFRYIRLGEISLPQIKEFKKMNLKQLPLLDENNRIVNLIDFTKQKSLLPLEVVLMAGGRGERLRPYTDTVPKPLLEVGGKAIIERNIDRLIEYGVSKFNITIKYLGDQLVDRFGDGGSRGVNIEFIREEEPLGTIGSVSLINNFSFNYVLVMNSDLLTNIDYEDFFQEFVNQNADMAVASIPYKVDIPYAVLERDGNKILSLKEKPTYTYFSNAGIYLIKRELLSRIPIAKYFNATDFMEELIAEKYNVVHYPINGYWLDIGKHDDFNRAQEDVKHIVF